MIRHAILAPAPLRMRTTTTHADVLSRRFQSATMPLLRTAAIGFFVLAMGTPARADLILDNITTGTGSYLHNGSLTTTTFQAVGLTTGTSAASFSSLEGIFTTGTNPGVIDGGIYSDAGGKPGSLLQSFNAVSVPANSTNVPETITAAAPFALAASTSYWFVLHDSVNLNWKADTGNGNFGTVPIAETGYTFNGYQQSINSGSTWASETSDYAVQIAATPVAVPEPLSLVLTSVVLGAAGGVGLLRRRFGGKAQLSQETPSN